MSVSNTEFIKRLHELRHHSATIGDESAFKMYDDLLRKHAPAHSSSQKNIWKGKISHRPRLMHFDPKASWNKENVVPMAWDPKASWNPDSRLVNKSKSNQLNPSAPVFFNRNALAFVPRRPSHLPHSNSNGNRNNGGKSRKHNKGRNGRKTRRN